ncbi:hypothetical protein FVE85_8461 [Porphyridium purpureum]|uniref:LITAF domain-containing protein n=1 Tax=Porphyridium purpureum TaxID=35688 RepID=A0A5J4YKI7_PORPP|nr:hypothetical protein FVE85_2484 [Porphyridium purpureum]KAA8491979.1 hypothetical protein FVE85_8461 [Porphyridium purpureum]|eukprot:POR9071..scf244_11
MASVQQQSCAENLNATGAATEAPAQPQLESRQTVYVQTGPVKMSKHPQVTVCGACGEKVQTKVEYNSCNAINWGICIFTGLCCVFIPGLCNSGTNTALHTCPKCGAFVGESSAC